MVVMSYYAINNALVNLQLFEDSLQLHKYIKLILETSLSSVVFLPLWLQSTC